MKKNLIIFDFDDTLVYTNSEFNKARDYSVNVIKAACSGLTSEEIAERITLEDIRLIREAGFLGIDLFSKALVLTYKYYVGQAGLEPDEAISEKLAKIGFAVYDKTPEIMPNVKEVLEEASKKYEIVLLSQGDEKSQLKRIKSCKLDKYFKNIFIVVQKNEAVFAEILHNYKVLPEDAIMIGNSIKSDLNPAFKVGMKVIHVDAVELWEFEHEEFAGDFKKITNLADCLPIIEEMLYV